MPSKSSIFENSWVHASRHSFRINELGEGNSDVFQQRSKTNSKAKQGQRGLPVQIHEHEESRDQRRCFYAS